MNLICGLARVADNIVNSNVIGWQLVSAIIVGKQSHMNADAVPKISVLMVSYAHEKFIRQALNSVIMQQTTNGLLSRGRATTATFCV